MPFKKLRKLDDKLTYFVYFNQKTYEYTHFREKKTVWLAWSTKRLLPALFIINLITFAATLYNALYVDKLFKYTIPSEYTDLAFCIAWFPLYALWFRSIKKAGMPFLAWNIALPLFLSAQTVYLFMMYGWDLGIPILNVRFLIMTATVIMTVFHIVYCLVRKDFFRYTLDEMKSEVEAKRSTAYTGRFDE